SDGPGGQPGDAGVGGAAVDGRGDDPGLRVGMDDRADVLAGERLGDVARGETVDDLDLFEVLGRQHQLEDDSVDRQRVELLGQELGRTDVGNQLRVAGPRGQVLGVNAVDVLDV